MRMFHQLSASRPGKQRMHFKAAFKGAFELAECCLRRMQPLNWHTAIDRNNFKIPTDSDTDTDLLHKPYCYFFML